MKMRFLPDKPITNYLEDMLGFSEFVEILQTSIYNTETPFVYGVLGDWGTGKTSIMKLLQNRLQKDLQNGYQPFVPIWFNAWKYENEENIVYPLLYAIKKDYDARVGQRAKSRDFSEKFKQVVASSALALTDVGLRVATKHLTGEALKLSDVKDQINAVKEHSGNLEAVLDSWADEVGKLDKAFENLLQTYAKDIVGSNAQLDDVDKVKFVILIDDLDRCLPDTTIAVLESIKNYLMVKNCVFVLGVNPKVIYQGIRIKYKNLDVDGREYLEKIVNYSFYVPEPQPTKVAEFTDKRLNELVLNEEARKEHQTYFREFSEILEECEFDNPRKIKRILNRYLFFINKYESELDKYQNANVVRLIILAEYFPNLFQLFLTKADGVLGALQDFDEPGFVEEFERRFSTSIASILPQLSRMVKLLALKQPTNTEAKLKLEKQAQSVFNITRLI